MNNTNMLISGDNKGHASSLFEKDFNPVGTLPGKGKFVGAFAATNLGDVSPNINGSFCMDTGLPCEMEHSSFVGTVPERPTVERPCVSVRRRQDLVRRPRQV